MTAGQVVGAGVAGVRAGVATRAFAVGGQGPGSQGSGGQVLRQVR
ncbi:MAG TPA: hypothetical protein VIY52_29820 [Streptosporangiaceae bacterium]